MKKDKFKIYKLFAFAFLVMFGLKTIVFADSLRCTDLGMVKEDLQKVFDFLKIVIPLLIIGLSTFDFIKAITGKDDKDVKKAFNRFLKRLVLAIVFFFLPVLINLLLDVFMIDNEVCIS